MTINQFCRTYVLLSSLAIPLLYAEPEASPNIANFNESGRQRILSIAAIAHNHNASLNNADTPGLNTTQLSALSGCKTQLGKQYLTDMLTHPVSADNASEIIANRQDCIKALVENPGLKQEIESYLEDAREQEKEIVTLFSDFFIGKACPDIKELELIKQQDPLFLATYRTGKTIQLAFAGLSLAAKSAMMAVFSLAIHDSIAWPDAIISAPPTALDAKVLGLFGCIGLSFFATWAAPNIHTLYKNYSLGSQKRVKLHALNKFIAVAEKTESLCVGHNMQKQFKLQDTSEEGMSLIKSLKKWRYRSKNTKVFDLPAVHSFLYTLYNHQDHLALLFASIAELDAYNALATKALESQQTN